VDHFNLGVSRLDAFCQEAAMTVFRLFFTAEQTYTVNKDVCLNRLRDVA